MNSYIMELMKTAEVRPTKVQDYELNEYEVYPEFTAEKQLELLSTLSNKFTYERIGGIIDSYIQHHNMKLAEAIAQMTSNAICGKYITKQYIRNILEKE